MQFPFIKVPDFHKEVEDEGKPHFYAAMSDRDKQDYKDNLINQRSMIWACKTAVAAYNLCMILVGFMLLINGLQVLKIIQNAITSILK